MAAGSEPRAARRFLHLGYAWAQRRRGQLGPVVDGGAAERVWAVIDELQAARVVLLGDIVHAPNPAPVERMWIEAALAGMESTGRTDLCAGQPRPGFFRRIPRVLYAAGVAGGGDPRTPRRYPPTRTGGRESRPWSDTSTPHSGSAALPCYPESAGVSAGERAVHAAFALPVCLRLRHAARDAVRDRGVVRRHPGARYADGREAPAAITVSAAAPPAGGNPRDSAMGASGAAEGKEP